MVFASAYSAYLRYFDLDGRRAGHWQDVLRVRRVGAARGRPPSRTSRSTARRVKALLRSLEDPSCPRPAPDMIARARRGVRLPRHARPPARHPAGRDLPNDQPLRATLGNLIRSQLSPMLQRLIGYYLAGDELGVVDPRSAARRRADPGEAARVVRRPDHRARPVGRLAAGRGRRRTGPPTSPTSPRSRNGPMAKPAFRDHVALVSVAVVRRSIPARAACPGRSGNHEASGERREKQRLRRRHRVTLSSVHDQDHAR